MTVQVSLQKNCTLTIISISVGLFVFIGKVQSAFISRSNDSAVVVVMDSCYGGHPDVHANLRSFSSVVL